ncbi:biopolymer transporter ExbD [Flavobacterium sp. DG1-102-2]|uniref:ExbD/TolR family protein n=1 Tax=Flavobacterium sp. DG1-102-2 TaxID=3081663 RepID=UPI002949838E|nr:biopolymer transporter ExbD [Flavobacterium sp. DG1-102-2]MDV6168199.1 biopolymer transporter ExbD [Flavobacterium sp. DG1-102-2]
MRVKRNKRFHAEIAASALSDIMFFLLLFFLIISTLANPNVIDLALPKADSNKTTDKAHVSISVTADKKYFIDKEQVPFEELEGTLMARVSQSGDNVVIVRLPKELLVQDMVDILQIGQRNKLKFSIATTK